MAPAEYTFRVTDNDLIKPHDAHLRLSLFLTQKRLDLEASLKGRRVQSGDFRGTVVGVGVDAVVARSEAGAERSFQLSEARLRQLLADTTRK